MIVFNHIYYVKHTPIEMYRLLSGQSN